ncbi:EAL domain-containing protein [Enterobacter huaxiensis]|uniref:EAL domain-containing protein n=1 Tax=Enterobacter huaxiensis TaxID=2494702 RepID=UPI0028BE24A8|nr:EAL domain-containing protein [Enterobacter huaxiensis]
MTAQNLTPSPSRAQHTLPGITGIKLEPIVALASSRTVGVEVLSVLSPHLQSECYFHDQSAVQSLMLLEAQLATLKKARTGDNLFINLPITVLTVPEIFRRLLQVACRPLNIEIVEPASFLSLSAALRARAFRHMQQLSAEGHRIWLDDVDEALASSFLSCHLPLSGVKIDKFAFWRLRDTPALAHLVSLCLELAANVLIEGIETDKDHACALQAGAGFGQGYYWPSWTWPED